MLTVPECLRQYGYSEALMTVGVDAPRMPRTLIADDQPDVLEALRLLLKREGYQIEAANSPKAVLERLEHRDYDVLLLDLNYARDTTSGQEGLDLLAQIQRLDNSLPVIVMTAWGSIPLAVEAMRRGARDFVQKPWDNAQLLAALRSQVESRMPVPRHEREEAAAVQRGMLPHDIPRVTGCEVAAAWRPLDAVGGDYVDILKIGENKLALCIADAIGKGMPAALLMSNIQAAVRSLASDCPADLTGRVNRLVVRNTNGRRFITCFYGVVDSATRRLHYTNAGHNAPFLAREDGEIERLGRGGAVLGIFPEHAYEEATIDLRPGDRLLLFTDGIPEVENAAGEQFGEQRLGDLLRRFRHLEAMPLQRKLLSAASDFAGGDFSDDVTLIVMSVG